MKNKFINEFMCAVLAVFATADFAYAQHGNILTMKTVAIKFSIAMIAVALFSVVIYLGLSLYNRFFVYPHIKDTKQDENSLHTPADIDGAVRKFIDQNRLK